MTRRLTDNAEAGVGYDIGALKVCRVWRHVRTGSLYVVLGTARCSTNGEREGEESVIYFSMAYQTLRYREVGEFLDGRFEPVFPSVT